MNAIRRRRVTIRLPRLPRAALAALAACLLSQMGGTGRLAGGGPVALADAASTAAGGQPGGQPTSGPDVGSPRATDPQFAPLLKICQKMGQRQWGQAIVETFDKAPEKDAWKVNSGTVEHKDGKLLVTAGPNSQAIVSHLLPATLKDSEGLRVEAWVQVKPMVMPQQMMNGVAFRNFNNTLFVGADQTQVYQWDYQYAFAAGNNGTNHSFNASPYGFGRGAMADEIKSGKLLHFSLELLGQQFRCVRDGGQPLGETMPNAPAFKVAGRMAIGFMCYSSQFAIVQMAYRGLTADKVVPAPDEWKQTPFADHQALTRFLQDRVVPRLGDPHFAARSTASELLAALWPLSKPAVDAAAAKGNLSAEGQLRLKALADCVAPIEVSKGQAEEAVKAPVTKDLPIDEKDAKVNGKVNGAPATQPARPLKFRRAVPVGVLQQGMD